MLYVAIIAIICSYGIASKKLLDHHGLHVLVTLIVYSGKLASLVSTVLKDAAYVENTMRLSVKKNLDIMDLPCQENYDSTPEEFYWPRSSSVEFINVTVFNDSSEYAELQGLNLQLKEASRVMLLGNQSAGVDAFKKVLVGQRVWETFEGQVKLDGKDLALAYPRGIRFIYCRKIR